MSAQLTMYPLLSENTCDDLFEHIYTSTNLLEEMVGMEEEREMLETDLMVGGIFLTADGEPCCGPVVEA